MQIAWSILTGLHLDRLHADGFGATDIGLEIIADHDHVARCQAEIVKR